MLCKLAWGNVRRSVRDYAVYFVTLALSVAVFYAFNTVTMQADFLSSESSQSVLRGLGGIIWLVTLFLAVVLGLLMVYANNFLVRRRKRELGLYQVLGMRPGQVARVLTLETLMASVLSFVAGIAAGVLLSQMLVFVTAALFHDSVTYFRFMFSPSAFWLTLGCFACMFAIMLVMNVVTLRRHRLVELMRAERTGEVVRVRSVPVMAALFVAGAVLVGVAYARLLHDGLPVYLNSAEEMSRFGLTTLMVVAGTVLLFYALSGFLLKVAQVARSFYWRDLNAFTMRELAARVNTMSVSMATIAMVLFLAITSVTGGLSICATITGGIRQAAPYDATISMDYYDASDVARMQDASGCAVAGEPVNMAAALATRGLDVQDLAGRVVQADSYRAVGTGGSDAVTLRSLAQASGLGLSASTEANVAAERALSVMGVSDYNALRLMRGLPAVRLGEGEGMLTCNVGGEVADVLRAAEDAGAPVNLNGHEVLLMPGMFEDGAGAVLANSVAAGNSGTLVVADDVARGLQLRTSTLAMARADGVSASELEDALAEALPDGYGMRLQDAAGMTVGFMTTYLTAQGAYASANSTTGLVSYLAIYIGFVLVVACAAILAIQQLSGASDASGRFRLLSELGCPEELMRRSLLRQTTLFFLAPLAVALAHSAVALRVVTDVVALFGSLDITTPALACACLFVAVYGAYLLVTYHVSRGVVRTAVHHGVRRD